MNWVVTERDNSKNQALTSSPPGDISRLLPTSRQKNPHTQKLRTQEVRELTIREEKRTEEKGRCHSVLENSCGFFNIFLNFVVPMRILPMGNSGLFYQGKPAATESRYPTFSNCYSLAYAVFWCDHTTGCDAYFLFIFTTDGYGSFNVRRNLGACRTQRGGWGWRGQAQTSLHKS